MQIQNIKYKISKIPLNLSGPQHGAPNLKRERPDDTTNQNKSKQLKRNNNDESTNESLDSMTEEIYVAQNNSMDSRFDSVTIKREDSVDLLDDIVDREHAPSIRINNFGKIIIYADIPK